MIYLSGAVHPAIPGWTPGSGRPFGELCHRRLCPEYQRWADAGDGIGYLLTPASGSRRLDGAVWAADTGCFADPEGFRLARYLRWLDGYDPASCLFAAAPDWPPMPGLSGGDWSATIDRFEETAPAIRAAGYRVGLVAQDGLEQYLDSLEIMFWAGEVDALFIGGSTSWKVSDEAAALVAEARRWGLWTHMGRCNSASRLRRADEMGCDSVDGTYLARAGLSRLTTVRGWLDGLRREPSLPLT